MGLYSLVSKAAVTVADSARSFVGRATYLLGLPAAHVLSTLAEWCGYRDAFDVHAAVLRAESAILAWAHRRAPDGRAVSPALWRCS